MLELNFAPEEGKRWTMEEAQGYYIQQIAKGIEDMNRQNRKLERALDLLQIETEKHGITKTALELMLNRSDVKSIFGNAEVLRLSDLIEKLKDKRIIGWISREELRKAIGETDYLETEKAGRGFMVRLIMEGQK
jgi:hypothetical protein